MTAVKSIISKIVWLILLLLGLVVVLMKVSVDVLNGEIRTDHMGMTLFFGGFIPFSISMLISPTSWRLNPSARNPLATVVVTRSWAVTAGLFLGLMLMASACILALAGAANDSGDRGLAITGLVILAAAALGVIFLQLSMSLKLSPEGLEFSPFKCGPIAWRDISAVSVERVLRSDLVALHIPNEEKYIQRGFRRIGLRWRWTRLFVSTPFSVPETMFDVSPEWLRRAIQIRIDHFSPANRPQTVQRQGAQA